MDKFQLNWEKHEEVFRFEPRMEKYCLSWDNHKKNVSEAFFRLRKDKHFCDVTLACEGRQFQAHKVVLSAGSFFFEQLLKDHNHPNPLVYLKGVEAKHMELLLDFMYCGELALEQGELESFLRGPAAELEVRGLAITPTAFGPAPKKAKPSKDNAPHPGTSSAEAIPAGDHAVASPPSNLTPTNTPIASVEKDMINEHCVALIKSEEKVATDEDSHCAQQVPEEWEDLEKFVIVKRDQESGGRRSFQCSLCGKVMDRSLVTMMAHIEAKHFRELFTHICDVCQESFKTKAILMSHLKRAHKNLKTEMSL